MNRVSFLVDGFNLYHSTVELEEKEKIKVKWLNLNALCTSFLHLLGTDAALESVTYFSAIPYYLSSRNQGKISRHHTYIKCLKATGIDIVLGRFKDKKVWCHDCKKYLA